MVNNSTRLPAPLPCAVRCIHDPLDTHPPMFYILEPQYFITHDSDTNPCMPMKIYNTQFGHALQMRACFMEMMSVIFEEFTLVKEDASLIWTNRISEPYDQFMSSLIPVIGDILPGRPNAQNDAMWKKYIQNYGNGFFAELCAKSTCMIQSHQNWNGYATGVGASMCNVALILHAILKGHTSENFHYDMPFATELTLGGHGHSDTVYSEYMIHKPLVQKMGGYHQSYY